MWMWKRGASGDDGAAPVLGTDKASRPDLHFTLLLFPFPHPTPATTPAPLHLSFFWDTASMQVGHLRSVTLPVFLVYALHWAVFGTSLRPPGSPYGRRSCDGGVIALSHWHGAEERPCSLRIDAETNVGMSVDDEVQRIMVQFWVGIGADRASCTQA